MESMPQPIPLPPKEFRTLLAQNAAVIFRSNLYTENVQESIKQSRAILEAAGLVEGAEETNGEYCWDCHKVMAKNCEIHTQPVTCGHTELMEELIACGNPLPCDIHG